MKRLSEKKKNILSVVLILIGFASMAIGVAAGEADTVFMKSVTVCLECIGIG